MPAAQQADKQLRRGAVDFVMTNLPGELRQEVGNLYGLRTWIADGFKHIKHEPGRSDHHLTDYAAIERWWELVLSAYLLVSLQTLVFGNAGSGERLARQPPRKVGRQCWLEAQAQQPTVADPAVLLSLPAPALDGRLPCACPYERPAHLGHLYQPLHITAAYRERSWIKPPRQTPSP